MKYILIASLFLMGCSHPRSNPTKEELYFQDGCLQAFVYVYENQMKPTQEQREEAIRFCETKSQEFVIKIEGEQ
jgi:hypothetical protein